MLPPLFSDLCTSHRHRRERKSCSRHTHSSHFSFPNGHESHYNPRRGLFSKHRELGVWRRLSSGKLELRRQTGTWGITFISSSWDRRLRYFSKCQYFQTFIAQAIPGNWSREYTIIEKMLFGSPYLAYIKVRGLGKTGLWTFKFFNLNIFDAPTFTIQFSVP